MKRTEAQQAVIDNRGGTLLVAAAAGSGKTSVLVERLLTQVMEEGKSIDRFLIITFTKAAAEELRTRIAKSLAEKLRQEPRNLYLRKQSILLYRTQISTIHSLCTTILREWGHSLGIPTDFVLCEEEDAQLMKLQALEDVLEQRYEAIEPESDFAQLLDLLSAGKDDARLVEITLDIYNKVQSHSNPQLWMQQQRTVFQMQGVADAADTLWGELLIADTKKQMHYWVRELGRILSLAEEEESLLPYAENLTESRNAILDWQEAADGGWDAMREGLDIPFPRLKAIRNCPAPELQTYIKTIRSNCKDAMARLQTRFADDSTNVLADMTLIAPAMLALFDLVEDFTAQYRNSKLRRGVLDFADLEHETVSLLLDAEGNPSEVAQQLAGRYAEIMVDEYQDTNQVQNAIFAALSNQEQNLFFVGDVKQIGRAHV